MSNTQKEQQRRGGSNHQGHRDAPFRNPGRNAPRRLPSGKLHFLASRGAGRRTRDNTYLSSISELLSGDGEECDEGSGPNPEVGTLPEPEEPEERKSLDEDDFIMGVLEEDGPVSTPSPPQPPLSTGPKSTGGSSKKKKTRKGRFAALAAEFREEAEKEGEKRADDWTIASLRQSDYNNSFLGGGFRDVVESSGETAGGSSQAIPMAVPGNTRRTSVGIEEAQQLSEQLELEVESMEEELALCMSAGSFDAIQDELNAFLDEENSRKKEAISNPYKEGSALSTPPSKIRPETGGVEAQSASPAVMKLGSGFERENLHDGPTDEEYYACEVFLDATSKVAATANKRRREIERLRDSSIEGHSAEKENDSEGAMSRSVLTGLPELNKRPLQKPMLPSDEEGTASSLPSWQALSSSPTSEEISSRLEALKLSQDRNGHPTVENPSTGIHIEVCARDVVITDLPESFQGLLNELEVGMGFKGGVARKMLKLLNGVNTEMEDIDVDLVLIIDKLPQGKPSVKAGSYCKQLLLEEKTTIDGHDICPEDIEVLSVGDLHGYYWRTRDITMNECLALRTSVDRIELFYTEASLADVQAGVIRCIPHCLQSHYCFMWRCDHVGAPILTAPLFERCLVRYLKGQGTTYSIDEDSWSFYRRTKLSPTSVFRIMKNFAESQEKMEAAAKHLQEMQLVGSHNEVNLLWNQKADEIKQASKHAVDLHNKMSIDDCERWAVRKLDQMKEMRDRVTTRAKSSGCALEGTRHACVSIPTSLTAYKCPMFTFMSMEEARERGAKHRVRKAAKT